MDGWMDRVRTTAVKQLIKIKTVRGHAMPPPLHLFNLRWAYRRLCLCLLLNNYIV